MPTQAWFSVPVYVDKAQNQELETIQKEISEVYQSLIFKQHPNWTSDTHELSLDANGNFFNDCILSEKKAFNFLSFIDFHVDQYLKQIGCQDRKRYIITQSWFTKTTKGKYAHLHAHGDHDISGVYYFQTNGNDGSLFFPCMNRHLSSNFIFSQISSTTNTIPLETGVIALWPSMLLHNTEPNNTDHERISISFNIKFLWNIKK